MLLKIFLVLVVIEVASLLWLKYTVGSYAKFWQTKAKESGQITYLALGDSAAQGIGATSPMRGYVGLVAERLQTKTGKTVRIINLSVSGATIQDCLDKQIPQIKNIKADYVTIEIGGNDIKSFEPDKFQKQFAELLTKLPPDTYVSDMPIFNSYLWLKSKARAASEIVQAGVAKNGRMHMVNLQKQTTEHQSIFGFAPDMFHPNNLSYKNWADAFWLQINK